MFIIYLGKQMSYLTIKNQVKELIESTDNLISDLSNVSSLLFNSLKDVSWVGFYIYSNEKLLLGPFMGKPACTEIEVGKGVCGTAFVKKETVIVKNVHDFVGHIACDSASNSEIVVPIFVGNKVVGVLDLDSTSLNRFDEEDKVGLEGIVKVVSTSFSKEQFKL
ncbi:MAG: GAF domain-containing protein [Bacilli bacterium]|nr:GAF domain-containing protein [Bacilli bacterium]